MPKPWMVRSALAVVLLASACVSPSRTSEDYRRKVANSAEAVVSAAESAAMTAELAADGRAPGRYTALRLSESEETAASVETSFGTVQPPGPEFDALRARTLTVIGDTADVLEELRLAAYRGELERLPNIAQKLEDPLADLRRLMEIAPT